jgi:hypothetical protein
VPRIATARFPLEALERPTRSLLLLFAGAGSYGAVLGSWHGPRLAAYAALKLPLVLLATALLTTPFAALMVRALGLRISVAQTARLALGCLALAALVMASLAPVAALFTWTGPPPSPAARTPHNLLYLLHTAVVGGSGVTAVVALRRRLVASAPSISAARGVLVSWIVLFALVGGEVAWALRPFVGSVFEPVALVRADALDGNVYEFIWTDVAPHLARRLGLQGDPP